MLGQLQMLAHSGHQITCILFQFRCLSAGCGFLERRLRLMMQGNAIALAWHILLNRLSVVAASLRSKAVCSVSTPPGSMTLARRASRRNSSSAVPCSSSIFSLYARKALSSNIAVARAAVFISAGPRAADGWRRFVARRAFVLGSLSMYRGDISKQESAATQ